MAIGNLFPEYLAQNTIFLPHFFGFGIPLTFSTCPYRIPLNRRCLVYLWILVPCVVTPCGIMVQCDQTNPFSYYMKGKSERAIILNCYDLLKISTFVTLEGWPRDFCFCPVCLLQQGWPAFSRSELLMCLSWQNVLTWDGFKQGNWKLSLWWTGFVLIWVIDVSVLTGCTDFWDDFVLTWVIDVSVLAGCTDLEMTFKPGDLKLSLLACLSVKYLSGACSERRLWITCWWLNLLHLTTWESATDCCWHNLLTGC